MRADPDIDAYHRTLSEGYEGQNYDRSLSGLLMREGHKLVERPFGSSSHFARVLEVGAGGGEHFPFVRHGYEDYLMTDASVLQLERARAELAERAHPGVTVARMDASQLSLPDASVDRVVACHILEHLYRPHEVLREWHRVLRPGGVLSILLPCDPGILWRLGRRLGPRAKAERRGIAYDYWMAREHVNPINNLVVFLRFYFGTLSERWYPARLPFSDLNLFCICHITKDRGDGEYR